MIFIGICFKVIGKHKCLTGGQTVLSQEGKMALFAHSVFMSTLAFCYFSQLEEFSKIWTGTLWKECNEPSEELSGADWEYSLLKMHQDVK
jgi:hypothetical protein